MNELTHAGVQYYYDATKFGPGHGPIHLDNVRCSGSEYKLTQCSYDRDTSEDSHYDDFGVTCWPGKKY